MQQYLIPSLVSQAAGVVMLILTASFSATGQSWEFAKEKDGIKLYTRKETGRSIKSFKGTTEISAPAAKVFTMLEDVNNTDWWDKSVNQIKVLLYERNKMAQYYLSYDLPWPVTDRDLCVDVRVTYNPETGGGSIVAGPLPGCRPEQEDLIRIKDYSQSWTVIPLDGDRCRVVLEGRVDPAGSIPDWISNMVVVDSPLKTIGEVKRRMEGGR